MSQPLVICCGGAKPKDARVKAAKRKTVRIAERGKDANLRIESIGPQILENLDPLCKDLVDIASYVYAADRKVMRGSTKDLGDRWKRDWHFIVPVRQPGVWKKKVVKALLEEALSFLSDDHYRFDFCAVKDESSEQSFLWKDEAFTNADCVSLFSGGMDSCAGVIEDVAKRGCRPILISHWPIYRTKSRQARLVSLLRERFAAHDFPHVQALINLRGAKHGEPTQRSRSFLYLAIAGAVAKQLGQQRIRIYENGVVALNLPIWRQTVGGMDTRTAHPRFLSLFQELMRAVLREPMTIENPFFFKTRADVAKVFEENGCADLIEATTSCSRIMFMSETVPHCGVCSQCIDRRVSLEAAGLSKHDPSGTYENDVFIESLSAIQKKKGWVTSMARAMAVGYVRAAYDQEAMSLGEFVEAYPQVYDAIPHLGLPEAEAVERIYELQMRQAKAVTHTMDGLVAALTPRITRKEVPADSLVALVAAQTHLEREMSAYARELGMLLADNLPVSFQSGTPKNERLLQDAGQAILNGAGEKLQREFPQLSFAAVVGSKPDFSTTDHRLFVEFKYPRPKSRTVGKISEEMAADVLMYRENGAAVLFVVYDGHRMIGDRKGFCAGFEKYDSVYVTVVV